MEYSKQFIFSDAYDKTKDVDLVENNEVSERAEARDPKFSKGQSKRIWNELYKVSYLFNEWGRSIEGLFIT